MKKLILLLFLFSNISKAQKNILDYIVSEKNDTIYGVIKGEKLLQITNNKTITHQIYKAKSIRKNDIVYHLKSIKNDSTLIAKYYQFTSTKPKLKDYIIKKSLDTVYGVIKSPIIGNKYIKNPRHLKVKICKKNTVSYRLSNQIFDLKLISKPILSIAKNVFLKRIYKGKASLYEYHILRNDAGGVNPKNFYIIEKNDILYLISNLNYKQQLIDLFIDHKSLVAKIDSNFYGIENIYLIMKYYDLK